MNRVKLRFLVAVAVATLAVAGSAAPDCYAGGTKSSRAGGTTNGSCGGCPRGQTPVTVVHTQSATTGLPPFWGTTTTVQTTTHTCQNFEAKEKGKDYKNK